ncbi:peptidase M16 [Litorimonas cladophorae]|uniref:Peptidase M16 n=1 Tax=Litorimonas cladophorae TaxID=1220491 RepID=A0A918KEY3_9PROT|nr:pitrilysin family protein [Litorimonas cladophorae]GGX59717.1 peptidase M16 [Litorimonas cladophorae]
MTSKIKLLLASAAIGLALSACGATDSVTPETQISLPTGVTLVETVSPATGDQVVIPYTKYKLDNGLTVVLHEDKSDPLVHVDVTYHVGSGREEPGRSGFAHFFEHMMFQGSENVADEEHFKIISESGGTLNGTTNADRTNYFETVPSNQLEKMLWLEADRMGFFLDAVTQQKFEVQRETVKNERGQRVDNRPYGLLFERVGEAMYPEGHPYSWSTIGYLEDLDRASLTDLKKFFLKWYGPNNATLTIGGDMDPVQTLEWVKTYFGTIPAGPEHDDPVFEPITLDQDRYISLEDNVQLPLIYMAWPTVHANHPDEAPLDVLANILGQGQTSLLYQSVVKPGLTVQASSGHGCREIHCTLTLLGVANPAKVQKLGDLEAIMREAFTEFEARGVMDDDLTRVKSDIVSGMIYGLESVSGKISQLAAYETYRDNPNGIGDDIARYEGVTKADVLRVYEQYIKSKPAVVMSIVPKGKPEMIAKADTWQRYERTLPDFSGETDEFNWTRPTDPEGLDRSVMPEPGPNNPQIKAPDTYEFSVGDGIEVLGARNTEVPTTTISLRIKAGQSHETLDKLGLAAMTAGLLNEATTERTVEELSNELDKLGSSVSFNGGDTFSTMYIRTLSKNLDATMAIAMEKLLKPKFDQVDFDRDKANALQGIKANKKEASGVASNLFNKIMYGTDNPTAYAGTGTEETVENITLDDVKAFYAAHYSPKIASIVAVSDLDEAAMKKALAPLSQWTGDDVAAAEMKPFPQLSGGTLYFVDKPDAAQSEIRIGKRALPYDATGEYYKSNIMNYPLGGAFNSRINLNLREDKGYTYGARSFFNGDEKGGWYRAGAGVRADATAASIVEFVNEIRSYHEDGATAEELAFTQASLGQSDARAYETPRQKLGFLSRMSTYGLKADHVDEQAKILEGMSKADMDKLAATHLNLDDMIMIVVGDKAKVYDEVAALGYTMVEIDADGNPI